MKRTENLWQMIHVFERTIGNHGLKTIRGKREMVGRRLPHLVIKTRLSGAIHRSRIDIHPRDMVKIRPSEMKKGSVSTTDIENGFSKGISPIGGKLPCSPDIQGRNRRVDFADGIVAAQNFIN